MRARAALCMILALAMAASGCGQKNTQAETAAPGYYGAGEVAYGGNTQAIEDLNVKSLTLLAQPEGSNAGATLQFAFVTGSRMSGGEQEQGGCGVPAYSVYSLNNPARLVIELENLAHWDYRHALDLNNPLLIGTFQHTLVDSSRMRIYIQLSQPVYFSAKAEGDNLTISLQPQSTKDQTFYYVTANAYAEYCAGTIPSECGVTPTLSADLQNTLLISKPFSTQEEADAFAAKARELCPALPKELWRTVSLKTGGLPAYDSTLDYLTASSTPAVRLPDGTEKALPVLVPDGLYLCGLPNNEGFLYSRETSTDSESSFQQLYKMKWDGQTSLATAFEFSAVEKAQYSPDGRKLAVLDRVEGSTHLYVFDADTYELLNDLSEMGFGGNTSTYLWNSLGNIIYAITGVDTIGLHQFDYSIPDEASRHSIVDADSVDEGNLGYCDGELYFANATMEGGSIIYRIKPEGGVRKPFTPGSRFAISSDAKYIAIVDSNVSGGSGAVLKLYDTATGSTRALTSDFYPYDCIWSLDCTKLYYIESRISGGQTEEATSDESQTDGANATDTTDTADSSNATAADDTAADDTAGTDGASTENAATAPADPYPYTLWVYDIASGKSEKLLDLAAPDLFVGGRADLLYLNRYETNETGTLMRAAYLLDLSSIFSADPTPSPAASPQG